MRREAARKKMSKKASSPKKMVMPKNVKMDKLAISKRKMKAAKKAKAPVKSAVVNATSKKARAFGQVIEYKNDVEFCAKLKAAFKKRRAAAKSTAGKRRKTKPVFGVITNSVKNAVSKALHSVPTKEIEKNPKQFLAKAERLEKSAMRFLEDFKSILGNEYKKSNITSEFGELEKAIKQFVAKVSK
jgi:vacuolar-type H+-ATPase subunit I/STV1